MQGIRILDTLNLHRCKWPYFAANFGVCIKPPGRGQHSQPLSVTRPSRKWPCHAWRWCDWCQPQGFCLDVEIGEGVSHSWRKISRKIKRHLMGAELVIGAAYVIYVYKCVYAYMRLIVLTYFSSWVSSGSMVPSGSIFQRRRNKPTRFLLKMRFLFGALSPSFGITQRVGCGLHCTS